MAVADLAILIKATDEASATLRSVGGLTRDLGSHAASSVTGFVSLSGAMAAGQIAASAFLGVAGGLITVFGNAATAATTFEAKLSAIQAVSGATKQEMADLSAKALQLGKDSSFSASEAADGIAELSKAGVKVADIMGGAAAASLDLAAAGGVSVAEAAEIASNAMNVFNIKGSDMAHVADQIAGAANASAIDVTDYKFSLSAAGAVAATVGVGFDDLTTSIALMGQAGIKGSDAGTSLKTLLLGLTPSSKSAAAEMRALGIITKDGSNAFFDATGKAKSMSEIAGILQHATAGLTEQQRLQALQTMFGTDAIRAAAIMAKAGAEGFDDMADSIKKISAADVARTRLNNLKGSMEAFKGSAETLAITIGIKLLPTFRAIVERGTALINTLIPLAEAIDLTGILEDVGDAISWVVGLFDRAYQAVGSLADEFEGAEDTIGFFVNRGLTLVAHELGLVSALLNGEGSDAAHHFSGAIDTAGDILATVQIIVMDFINDAVIPLVDWLADRIPPVLSWLVNTGWPLLVAAMQAVASFVTGTLVPGLSTVVSWLGAMLQPPLMWLIFTGWPLLVSAISAVSTFITGTVVPAIQSLATWLSDHVPPAVNAVLGAFEAVRGRLTPIVQAIFGGDLSAALAGLGGAFAAFATLAIGWIGAQVALIDWAGIWARATSVVLAMGQWFTGAAASLAFWIGIQVAQIDWAGVWARASSVILGMGQWFVGAAASLAFWIGDQIATISWSALWARAVNVVTAMASWFAGLAGQLATWIGDKVALIDWSALWARAVNVISAMASWFGSLAVSIAGWIGTQVAAIDWTGVWAKAVEVGSKMAQWFVSVATDFAGWISAKVAEIDWSTVWAKAVSVAASMAQWFSTVATDFAGWLGEKVAEIDWGTLWSKAVEVSGHMAQWFTDTATKFTQWLGENVALIDWAGVWAKAVNAATSFTTWMTDTIAAMNWDAIGQYVGALLVWAAVEAIKVAVGLAAAMATWISDSITAAFNGDAENGPAGKFLKSLDGMIQAVKTGFIQLLIGMVRGAWDAAMAQFTPTMPAISAGGSTQPQSGNGSSGGSTVNLNQGGSAPSSANYGPIDNSSRAAFVKSAWPYMLDAAGGDRDLAEMMLAKAISENGDVGKGGSFIGNNFSGIKGKGSAGSFTAKTWEWEGGQRVYQDAEFAAYKTPQEGFAAFMGFLKDNSRYKGALSNYQQGGGANKLFEDINAAGYATDPNWAATVQNIRKNQVAPITGGLSGNSSSSQTSEVVAGLQNINTALEATKSSYTAATQASVSFNNTLPNAQEALASVTATLQGQYASLQANGTANLDLVRDTLPTINTLEQQGTISKETADQLRSMALSIMGTGDSATTLTDTMGATNDAVTDVGDTATDVTRDYRTLASTFRSTALNPQVNTDHLDELATAAGDVQDAVEAIGDVVVTPGVNAINLEALRNNEAPAVRAAVDAIDNLPVFPGTNLSALEYLRTSESPGVQNAIASIDDPTVTPSTALAALTYLKDTYVGQVATAVASIDDQAVAPTTNLAALETLRTSGSQAIKDAIAAIDDLPVFPQTNLSALDHLRTVDSPAIKAALAAIDDDKVDPQTKLDALVYLKDTYAGQVKTAIDHIDDPVVTPATNLAALTTLRDTVAPQTQTAVDNVDLPVVTPVVHGEQLDAAQRAAEAALRDINAIDDTPAIPQVYTNGVNGVDIADTKILGLGTHLLASDDTPAIPQVYTNGANGVDIADTKILGLGTDLLRSDDTAAIPQVYTNGTNGVEAGDTKILGLQPHLLASDDVAAIPQVWTNDPSYGVDIADTKILALRPHLLASDDTAAIPQVWTNDPSNGVDLADAKIEALQTDLLASDNTAAIPQVWTNDPSYGVERANDLVEDLSGNINDVATPHSLTFSGNVPSSVTVSTLTGSNTNLNNSNLNGVGSISTNGEIKGSKLQTNKIENAGNIQTGLIQTGFTFNFAAGGRPPLNTISMVGEMGPELFIPDSAGTIIPAGMTQSILSGQGRGVSVGYGYEGGGGGGTTVVVNLTVTGNTILGDDRKVIQELARKIQPELNRRVGIRS